ncbi:MAG: zf-HC2 domain-containing protein [Betaproteobacteria bacterium]|nr:zf-HC2 domain-containing protein [Betaproteobacteria bacterium]
MKEPRTLSCEEALKDMYTFLDHELGEAERRDLEEHLRICRSCFSRVEFEKRLRERLADTGQSEASGDLQNRIRSLIGRF